MGVVTTHCFIIVGVVTAQYCGFAFSFIVGVSSGKVSQILQDSGGGHCSTLVVLQLCFYSGGGLCPTLANGEGWMPKP